MTCVTVERAIREHPDVFARVRAVCTYGAVNLDLHAARIVLNIASLREKQGWPIPSRASASPTTKGA